jgi:hypothetical protein
MDDDPHAQARAQLIHAQLVKDVGEISELGRQDFGSEDYDNSLQTVIEALGDDENGNQVAALLREAKAPHVVVYELGRDPETAKRFARMNPVQRAQEIGRVEQEKLGTPVRSGAAPTWRQIAGSGRLSDAEWKSNYGANLTDAQWNREFDRRMGLKSRGDTGRAWEREVEQRGQLEADAARRQGEFNRSNRR